MIVVFLFFMVVFGDCSVLVGKEVLVNGQIRYFCVRVFENIALLSLSNGNIPLGYEVWKIRPVSGRFSNKWNLRFPSNEDFGRYGWSYQTREAAEEKFRELLR